MYIIGLYNQQLCHGQELECISIFFVAFRLWDGDLMRVYGGLMGFIVIYPAW